LEYPWANEPAVYEKYNVTRPSRGFNPVTKVGFQNLMNMIYCLDRIKEKNDRSIDAGRVSHQIQHQFTF
jgi:hypothetical protein